MPEPLPLSVDAILAAVPGLVDEVRRLRSEVDTLKGRQLRCEGCGSSEFRTLKTQHTALGIKRRKECRGCGRRATTREVIE